MSTDKERQARKRWRDSRGLISLTLWVTPEFLERRIERGDIPPEALDDQHALACLLGIWAETRK